MSNAALPRSVLAALRTYGVAVGLCLIILTLTLKLWHADLHVPLAYANDALFSQLWIKGIIENGWYLHHDRLAAPAGTDLHDFPLTDNFHFGVLWLLTRFSADTALVFNLFFLLSFPLVAITALAVLRELRISDGLAVVLTLLYTFLPYHFLRGLIGHIFLMSYFMVPPLVLVALWICLSRPRSPSLAVNEEEVVAFGKTRWCIALVACLLAASTGIYYAAFGCFLLVIAGLYCLGHQYWRGCAIAVALTAILFLGVGTNLLPSALYRFAHGANREAVVRNPQAAEIYGMKVTQLVLPMSVHRLPWIGRKKLLYNTAMPWGSSDYGYLGAIGVAGFLILVGRFLVKRSRAAENRLLDVVQTLNLFAVLFATVGGFGMVASLYLGAWLRCFERMSIVIGFLSLLAVGLVLDRSPWLRQSHRRRAVVLGILLAVGILEQTSVHFVPPYNALAREYAHDAAFIARIESEMPAGATIFQLPYMSFPENGPLCRIGDYEPVRGYLHSYSLRWSYGAVKGRKADAWQRTVAGLPVADMVQNLTTAGFQGIYIDRRGYEDKGASLERDLTELRGRTPLTSPNGRLSFFDIRPYERPETETANCPWQARVH